ncbi:hypothetical protein PR048_000066 [Dryococelus australis]|uniref:Uncharacterized protein n=1 Tax=Dryococelus australis TaxID=614101 RepID=A0ABQ9IET4_9NEOP|nr:hypothetical protein PR048_000066 [Dryococelus australis]
MFDEQHVRRTCRKVKQWYTSFIKEGLYIPHHMWPGIVLLTYGMWSRLKGSIFHDARPGAAEAERLAYSPPTKANRLQSSAGSLPYFRMWESCQTMPLVGGFPRGSPVSTALSFQRRPILISITLIGSQHLAYSAGYCSRRLTSLHGDARLEAAVVVGVVGHEVESEAAPAAHIAQQLQLGAPVAAVSRRLRAAPARVAAPGLHQLQVVHSVRRARTTRRRIDIISNPKLLVIRQNCRAHVRSILYLIGCLVARIVPCLQFLAGRGYVVPALRPARTKARARLYTRPSSNIGFETCKMDNESEVRRVGRHSCYPVFVHNYRLTPVDLANLQGNTKQLLKGTFAVKIYLVYTFVEGSKVEGSEVCSSQPLPRGKRGCRWGGGRNELLKVDEKLVAGRRDDVCVAVCVVGVGVREVRADDCCAGLLPAQQHCAVALHLPALLLRHCRNNTQHFNTSLSLTLQYTHDEEDGSRWLRTTNIRVPTLNCFSANTSSENDVVWIIACGAPLPAARYWDYCAAIYTLYKTKSRSACGAHPPCGSVLGLLRRHLYLVENKVTERVRSSPPCGSVLGLLRRHLYSVQNKVTERVRSSPPCGSPYLKPCLNWPRERSLVLLLSQMTSQRALSGRLNSSERARKSESTEGEQGPALQDCGTSDKHVERTAMNSDQALAGRPAYHTFTHESKTRAVIAEILREKQKQKTSLPASFVIGASDQEDAGDGRVRPSLTAV